MSEFIVSGQRAEDGIAIDFSKPAAGELVRCKECKYWINHDKRCARLNHGMKINDYCSYGEKKDESDTTDND